MINLGMIEQVAKWISG